MNSITLIEIIGSLNLIASFQAVFLTSHFAFKRKGKKALNYVLMILCLCIGVIGFNTFVHLSYPELWSQYLDNSSKSVVWLIGPLFYLFTTFKTDDGDPGWIHLWIGFGLALTSFWFQFEHAVTLRYARFIYLSIYFFLATIKIVKHYKVLQNYLKWIVPICAVFVGLIIFNFLSFLLSSLGYLVMSMAAQHGMTVLFIFPIFYIAYLEMNVNTEFGISYSSSILTEQKVQEYLLLVKTSMEKEEAFLNPKINLNTFSQDLGIPAKHVSQVVNSSLNMNFSEYVSSLRVEKAKDFLLQNSKSHLSLTGVGMEAGFSSSSRFYHQFRKRVGCTPKEYKLANS